MPAAVRTIASMTRRCTGARPRLWASDSPPRSVIGTPTASANAIADGIRISGSISRPPTSASRELRRQAGRDLVDLHHVAVARRRADRQRPQRGGEAEDVAGGRDGAAREHLGRHVARRADRDRADRLVAADRARDAEVHEHDAVVGQDHVLRLDVAVHDLLVVHVLERLAGVAGVLDRLVERQPGVAAVLELGAEVGAADELHDDVEALLVLRVVEHLDDARVAEAGEQPRLDLEAGGVAQVEQALDARPRRRVSRSIAR